MLDTRIRTFTGKLVDVIEPDPAHIDLLDIAHALSYQNRFNGHTWRPSSVARHSIVVARMVSTQTTDERVIARALLHDGSEGFIGDMVKPLKQVMPEFQHVEDRIEAVINAKFNIEVDPDEWKLIKNADVVGRQWEQRDIVVGATAREAVEGVFDIPAETYPAGDPSSDRFDFITFAADLAPLEEYAIEALKDLARFRRKMLRK